jgi:hypothetical protein
MISPFSMMTTAAWTPLMIRNLFRISLSIRNPLDYPVPYFVPAYDSAFPLMLCAPKSLQVIGALSR